MLPLLGWAVTGDRAAYQLPARLHRPASCPAREFEEALRTAGFAQVSGEDLFPGGVASLVVGAMKLVVAVGGASGSIYARRLLDIAGRRRRAACPT